jgi:hypothetical protein
VKSVSTLWAVAEPAVAAAVERAHLASLAFSGHLILWYFRLLFGW